MALEEMTGDIDLKLIEFRPNNREKIDESEIDQLAETMKVKLLNAIILQPHPTKKKHYEVVAGERRVRAARKLGWKTIAARVFVGLTDADVEELRIIENVQRSGLTVWEEANQLAQLKEKRPDDPVEAIAAKVGMGADWVACRLAIGKLIPELRKLVTDQEWPVTLMPLLARVPVVSQPTILEEIKNRQKNNHQWREWDGRKTVAIAPSKRELKEFLEDFQRLLTSANWKLDDATLVPAAGACNVCPKRSSSEPHLFSEEAGGGVKKDDRCLDAECWNGKVTALVVLNLDKLRADGVKPLLLRSQYQELDKDTLAKLKAGKTEQGGYNYTEKKKAEKGTVQAIYVDGEKAGKVVHVKPYSFDSGGGSKPKREIDQETGKPKPPSKKVRLTALRQKRQCRAVDLWLEKLPKLDPEYFGTVDRLLIAFGTDTKCQFLSSWSGDKQVWKTLAKIDSKTMAGYAWKQLYPVLQARVKRTLPIDKCAAELWKEATAQAKAINFLKVLIECWKTACEEIKLPKVLERDGVKDDIKAPAA